VCKAKERESSLRPALASLSLVSLQLTVPHGGSRAHAQVAEAKAFKDAKNVQWPFEDEGGRLLPTGFGEVRLPL
jgi:hypothetical protein